MRQTFATCLIVLMLTGLNVTTSATPSLTIKTPPNNSVLLSKDVNISGTAAGSEALLFQTTQADFDQGTKNNVTTAPGGNISLLTGQSIYDDFNDNNLDSSRWTPDQQNGLSITEASSQMRIAGSSQSSTWWAAVASATMTMSFPTVSVDLLSFSGTGSYNSYIYLYQDIDHRVVFGVDYDPPPYGDQPILWYGDSTLPGTHDMSLGALPAGVHTFKLSYSQGTVYSYLDGVLKHSVAMELTNYQISLFGRAHAYGDSLDARWDDFKADRYMAVGNYTSGVLDTHSVNPVLKKVSWGADTPSGTGISVQLRSSDAPDMSTATGWASINNGQTAGLPGARRFVQYRVFLTSSDGLGTPVFKDITIIYNKPVKKVELSIDNQASWLLATGTAQWSILLSLPENTTKIWVRATDVADDTNITSMTLKVDTTAPSGSIGINGGEAATDTADVTLRFNATDNYGVASVMFGEDAGLLDGIWETYQPAIQYTLSSGEGMKTVYARFLDVNGHESDTVNASIILDTATPTGSIIINDGAAYTNDVNVMLTLSAADGAGIQDMMMSNYADFTGGQWMPYRTLLDWTILPGNGERTVHARFRDMGGHATVGLADHIILDTISPILSVELNNGSPYTSSPGVAIRINATDNNMVESMIISQSSDFSGAVWEPFQGSTTLNLATGDGLKTVFGKARDAAGNEGPIGAASIILDTVPPAASVVGLPKEVDTPNFTVNWSGTDAVSGIASYDIQYRDGAGPWIDWLLKTNRTSAIFNGPAGHNHSFRARARDLAGNVGSYPDFVDNPVYIWPKYFPTVTVSTPKPGSLATGTLKITGTASQPDRRRSVASVQVRIDSGEWQTADGTLGWSFRLDTRKLGDGTHTLIARAFDGERYSNETNVSFLVNNLEASTTLAGLPLVLLAILIVGIAGAGALLLARQKRHPPVETPLPPEAASPPTARPPQAPPSVQPPAPLERVAVVSKVNIDDLDEEEALLPPVGTTVPPAEPVPVEPPAPSLRDETSMREGKILKALSSLPRSLPSSLWGLDMDELASKVVAGERKDSPDGDMLVKISNRWYYGDETNLGLFMQEFRK